MELDHKYPTLHDLRNSARRRIPRYLWDYLEGGTGAEFALTNSAAAMDAVTLVPPAELAGTPSPDLATELLGQEFGLPLGIAPVGMSGAIWPDAEVSLARLAEKANIPYCLSSVAAATPEEVGPHAGTRGWFQLYPPADPEIRRDILSRAKAAGFGTLVFTVDVPVLSRRPRDLRHRLANPMRLTPRILLQTALRPAWALAMATRPVPRPRLFDKYAEGMSVAKGDKHLGLTLRCTPDWPYFDAVRSEWDGPLVVKGLLHPAAAAKYLDAGADAVWVSNHGGRQFDAAPAPIDVLPAISEAVGRRAPVIYDGAVRSGTDVLRALARGADFVMLGRAFHYGLGAAGPAGAAHVIRILTAEMETDMAQLCIDRPAEARFRQ